MNIKNIAKKASALTVAAALLAGGAPQTFAKETQDYKKSYGFSHITRHDMLKIPEQRKRANNLKFLNSIRKQSKTSLLQKGITKMES